jgi:hypothetical protein
MHEAVHYTDDWLSALRTATPSVAIILIRLIYRRDGAGNCSALYR